MRPLLRPSWYVAGICSDLIDVMDFFQACDSKFQLIEFGPAPVSCKRPAVLMALYITPINNLTQ